MKTKQNLSIFFLLLTFSFLFISCSEKEISLPNPELKKIYGKWDWSRTSGGFTGGTSTPKTEGFTVYFELEKNGTCKWYQNDQLVNEVGYILKVDNSNFYIDFSSPIQTNLFLTDNNYHITFYGNDTIHFSLDNCYDCFYYDFVRQK